MLLLNTFIFCTDDKDPTGIRSHFVRLTDPSAKHPQYMGTFRQEQPLVPLFSRDLLIDKIAPQRFMPPLFVHNKIIAGLPASYTKSTFYSIIIKVFNTIIFFNITAMKLLQAKTDLPLMVNIRLPGIVLLKRLHIHPPDRRLFLIFFLPAS